MLIPRIGIAGTTYIGMAASLVAALGVIGVLRRTGESERPGLKSRPSGTNDPPKRRGLKSPPSDTRDGTRDNAWLPAVVLGLSGFASLLHEIAWTRILSLVLGPTTYAFAAALAAVIAGVAIGSGAGTWIVARTVRPAAWLASTLSVAALITSWTYSIAGNQVPMFVARQVAGSSSLFDQLLAQGALLTAALVMPTAVCLGAAFPLALALANDPNRGAAGRFSLVYAVNTLGAVSGSLAAGFWFIPRFGLQPTLWTASGCLVAAALVVVVRGEMSPAVRVAGAVTAVLTATLIAVSPSWDRELLASGVYMYAPYVPQDLDLETQLKAGTLLYYREGASATVSVKRLTGTTTLAVDGKTDASNRGDMLTQKLVAHLPLLLHDNPRQVGIIGLGSGVTVGAALAHPIVRADVLEISPEVVQASAFFTTENRHALEDPRTHLIVLVALSKLMASIGSNPEAVAIARQAAGRKPAQPIALEQLASLFADGGDLAELDATVSALRAAAPRAPAGLYYAAAAAFMRGDAAAALRLGQQAIAIDANYAPVYDLMGAAHTRLGQPDEARAAFRKSLAFDAHDSTAYTNLGVLELGLGRREQAARYFAEALWLTPDSPVARQGLAESKQ